MMGPTPFRDILLVAGFELKEMLRSRKAIILIALYMLGGLAASRAFVGALGHFETLAAQALGTTATQNPGALTNQMLKSESYRAAVMRIFSDPKVADFLLSLPPIVLFFAWSSLAFVPILIMITASDTVTQETQDRGARFALLRTGRLEFVLGKYLGQTLLMALVTLLASFVYVWVAAYYLQGFELGPTLHGIALFWPRVVIYGTAFVGLSGLCAMNTSSTNMARAMSLLSLIGTWVVGEVAYHFADGSFGVFWEAVGFLIPFSHKSDLWAPDLATLVPTCLTLIALCGLYLSVGLLFFRKKDL